MPFRPRFPGEFPTLGHGVLQWTHAYLPSPRDEREPLLLVPWQAERVLRYYELDPVTGRRLYRRCHDEDAKGLGKSPLAAAVALAEFCGPVIFDGWDADSRPVGRPWGTGGSPPPWVQVAATSEDQTRNTWLALYGFLLANKARAADELRIDTGRTQLYHRDKPSAYMERVTSSAAAREGQPVTHAVMDEPQLWMSANGGIDLSNTILRNLTKMGGWAHFTGNAPILGQDSVAELLRAPAPDALHMGRRASVEPAEDWTAGQLRPLLAEIYDGVPWADLDWTLAAVMDRSQTPWADAKRFFFNLPVEGRPGEPWMPDGAWEACADNSQLTPKTATYASVRVARDYRSAAVAMAQRHGDDVVLRCRTWEADDLVEGELIELGDIEAHLLALHRTWSAYVVAEQQYHPGSKTFHRPRPGPEVTYHGSFFERSRQTLEKAGVVMVAIPDSATYLAPAAQRLMGLVLEDKLHHDGDADLARHVGNVVAKVVQGGVMPIHPDDDERRIEAALAAMHAVSRALTAPRPPSRKVHGLR